MTVAPASVYPRLALEPAQPSERTPAKPIRDHAERDERDDYRKCAQLNLFQDREHGCSHPHPERRTARQISAAFDALRAALAEAGVTAGWVLIAEAELVAKRVSARRRWLDDVALVGGELVCIWCQSDDFYDRLREQLAGETASGQADSRAFRAS